LGAEGRKFKSCHPDHFHRPPLTATHCRLAGNHG
jgi:hypothetical protein